MPSFEELYELALAAAEKREKSASKRPDAKRKFLKVPCPADRLRETDEGIECVSRRKPAKAKVGHAVVNIKGGVVNSPKELAGIPARSLRGLDTDLKRNRALTKECSSAEQPMRHQTFAGPKQALDALFRANPLVSEAIYRIWPSKIDDAYVEWVHRGMRGPRPTLMLVYGNANTANLPNIDFLSGFTDKGGKRKIYSITEALYASIPHSRKWSDWLPVLQALQAEINAHADADDYIAHWHEIKIPGRAGIAYDKTKMTRDYCKANEPKTTARIIQEHKAKVGERQAGDDEGDVPF